MSDTGRHLTWENFETHFLRPARPALHRIPGAPSTFMFVDDGGSRIGIRLMIGQEEPKPSPLTQIEVRKILHHGENMLEVSCSTPALYKEFFLFSTNLADLVQLEHTPPLNALEIGVRAWSRLLQRSAGLSEEQELGLIGELWLLERLVRSGGSQALVSWVGPSGEDHDFRYGEIELEVKTTSQTDRVHVINGAHQLETSPSHTLFLLSIHLQPSGGQVGFSLADLIGRCRERMTAEDGSLARFNGLLDQLGVNLQDEPRYQRRFNMRSDPVIIDVETECPRITADALQAAMSPGGYQRLRGIRYSINVEGLGSTDGSQKFVAVVPQKATGIGNTK
jgi:hypothetical protein